MPKKLSTKEFIEKAKQIHGDKYDYSLVNYKNNKTKVKIICPKHGEFEQIAGNHLRYRGCRKCVFDDLKNTEEEFIKKAKKIHGDKYDYSLVEYKNSHKKVKIICPIHGIFEQAPVFHINRKQGCFKCSREEANKKESKTTEEFIKKAHKVHGDRYDYSLVEYKTAKIKVKIICPIHGIFEQRPDNHINRGDECPKCKSSSREEKIRVFLENNNISYEKEKRFEDCRNKRELPFDFYLPKYNILIEHDGQQHFKAISIFGGEKALKETQKRDEIKNKFAKENNIELLRIKYDENIEEKLSFLKVI